MVADHTLDVLALPDWRIHPDGDLSRFAQRHIGIACRMSWHELCGYLSRGVPGDPWKHPDPQIAKRQEGGWTGGLFRDGWRHHDAFVHTEVLTVDIDGHGEVRRAAAALAPFRKAIHSTYKSTPEAPRCRVVLQLSEPCTDLRLYKAGHAAVRERLYAWGYLRPDKKARIEGDIDEGASDATRLNYAPMYHPDRQFDFLAAEGELLDLAKIPPAPPPAPTRPRLDSAPRERNPNRYRDGALRRAEDEVRTALEGQRHATLFREAASLARAELGLSDADIHRALHLAFVAAAGEHRAHEAERTIANGIARERGGS